jgi:hypothetical protein
MKTITLPAQDTTLTAVDFILHSPENLGFQVNISAGLQVFFDVNLEFTLGGVPFTSNVQPVRCLLQSKRTL